MNINAKHLTLSVLVALSLTGCKEKETGLEKQVINAAHGACLDKLTGLLKSPSSLKVNKVDIFLEQPNADLVFGLYHDNIIDKEKGRIKESYEQVLKPHYRTLRTSIEYDAQNSFGTMLRGHFFCEFAYEINTTGNGSNYLEWSKIISDNGVEDFATGLFLESSVMISKYSNWKLHGDIRDIFAEVTVVPNDKDKNILQEVLEISKSSQDRQSAKQPVQKTAEEAAQEIVEIVDALKAEEAAKAANEAAQEALAEMGLSAIPHNK